MAKRGYFILIGFVLFMQTTVAFAGQLSSSLEQYKARTQTILAEEENEVVKTYLFSCLSAANNLDGLEAGDQGLSAAFSAMVNMRLKAASDLTPETSGMPGVVSENQAYNANLQPYIKSNYVNLIALQDQLLERKYFKTETSKNANFVEGYINSMWSLTRADHSDIKKVLAQPHLGVSPWEAIFRLEPTLAFDHGAQAAILGTAGLSYTFFPDIDSGTTPMKFKEDVWSKWVQKSGVRLGVGVGNLDNHAKLLLGAGTQINALGLWGLYKPDGGTFMFGLGASDLSKLKKFVTWFE
jgi:hypothetical protein